MFCMKEGSLSKRRMNSASSSESRRSCNLSVSRIMIIAVRFTLALASLRGRSDHSQFLYAVRQRRQSRILQDGIPERFLLFVILAEQKDDLFAGEELFFRRGFHTLKIFDYFCLP